MNWSDKRRGGTDNVASRHQAWLKQARSDLRHANASAGLGNYDWACFAAQQAAEKALKAVFQRFGGDAWGHSVNGLLTALPDSSAIEPELADAAKELDKHYIPTRYPNSHPQGAPFEHYTQGEAHRAITNAEKLIVFCESLLAGSE